MRSILTPALSLFLSGICLAQPSLAAEPQAAALTEKQPVIMDLNTPRKFPAITSREQWQARAAEIREQVLVSCGLWPLP